MRDLKVVGLKVVGYRLQEQQHSKCCTEEINSLPFTGTTYDVLVWTAKSALEPVALKINANGVRQSWYCSYRIFLQC